MTLNDSSDGPPLTSIRVRPLGRNRFGITFWFLGKVWHLKTSSSPGPTYWMLLPSGKSIWIPLKTFFGGRWTTPDEDDTFSVLEEAKFQILRLKFLKPSPTFNEQHSYYKQLTSELAHCC